ncbi:hypothetical protein SPO0952 [Ruegeria pomeroyi DSS-3]|uniref:Uncharacterized protein n=1 Tax=Ruegeria pomeroyi (strain ATCC 700808 / DSM 15171 / DSS-3) TaxID=246200 RepID=Q5LUV0_RUEPO|nr:hypothetical protein SPO0952 [Ruegeria pomeroyi DSS-3]
MRDHDRAVIGPQRLGQQGAVGLVLQAQLPDLERHLVRPRRRDVDAIARRGLLADRQAVRRGRGMRERGRELRADPEQRLVDAAAADAHGQAQCLGETVGLGIGAGIARGHRDRAVIGVAGVQLSGADLLPEIAGADRHIGGAYTDGGDPQPLLAAVRNHDGVLALHHLGGIQHKGLVMPVLVGDELVGYHLLPVDRNADVALAAGGVGVRHPGAGDGQSDIGRLGQLQREIGAAARLQVPEPGRGREPAVERHAEQRGTRGVGGVEGDGLRRHQLRTGILEQRRRGRALGKDAIAARAGGRGRHGPAKDRIREIRARIEQHAGKVLRHRHVHMVSPETLDQRRIVAPCHRDDRIGPAAQRRAARDFRLFRNEKTGPQQGAVRSCDLAHSGPSPGWVEGAKGPDSVWHFPKMPRIFGRPLAQLGFDSSLSWVRVSKSLASWRSRSWYFGSPETRLTMRPRLTPGRASSSRAQRITWV